MKVNDEIEQAFREGYEMGHSDKARQSQMIKEIAQHYGYTSQADIMIEECAELVQAILKLRRAWNEQRLENVKEETADVLIMALELRYILGADDIDNIVTRKLIRQKERIADEEQGQVYNQIE